MKQVRLAVVGSTQFEFLGAFSYAREIIETFYHDLNPDLVISGGAIGIDTLGISIARIQGIAFLEHLPKNNRWAPEGFKDRNELIAQDCTHLLRITCHTSTTYGSGWTRDIAKDLGKIIVGDFVL